MLLALFFSGSEFLIDYRNFSYWQNDLRGLEALLNPSNYLLGFALVFLAKIMGAMYFINNIDHKEIRQRAVQSIKYNMIIFYYFFLVFWAGF